MNHFQCFWTVVTCGRMGIKAVCRRRDFRLSAKKTQAKNVVATVKNEKVVYNCINDFILHYYLFTGEGNGTPLQCSCLENPMDGGAWWAAVHGVMKSRTQLSDLTFPFHFHALEKDMATHSSVLAWRIPGMAEPGGLPSVGSHRVGHD